MPIELKALCSGGVRMPMEMIDLMRKKAGDL